MMLSLLTFPLSSVPFKSPATKFTLFETDINPYFLENERVHDKSNLQYDAAIVLVYSR